MGGPPARGGRWRAVFDVDHGEEQARRQGRGVELDALDAGHAFGEEVAVRILEGAGVAADDPPDLGDDAGAEEVGGVTPAGRRAGDQGELDDGGVGGAVAGGGLALFVGEERQGEARDVVDGFGAQERGHFEDGDLILADEDGAEGGVVEELLAQRVEDAGVEGPGEGRVGGGIR